MLGTMLQKPMDEKARKEAELKRRHLLLGRAARMKKLTNYSDGGWPEYQDIVMEYVDFLKKKKALTRLDTATPEMLQELKLLDREIFILTWALRIPQSIMKQAEEALKKKEESNEKAD